MEKYTHLFTSQTEYNDYVNSDYKEPFVSVTSGGGESTNIKYNLNELGMYLTFEIVSGGTLYWRCSNTANVKTIDFRKNGSEWSSITSSQDNDGSGTTITTIVAGDVLEFRGINTAYCDTSSRYNHFKGTSGCRYYVFGNVMSLINYNNFRTNKTFQTAYTVGSFRGLFYLCDGLLSHPNWELCLPATSLNDSCYYLMFGYCSNLERAPKLPATVMKGSCYWGMFEGCTSLKCCPELPAKTLALSCYKSMFKGCTSLVEGPVLPTTALTYATCYAGMFENCTNLTIAPKLPATSLSSGCYNAMFKGCTKLKVAPELPATTLVSECYAYMFYQCSNLEVAPELLAPTLVYYCYGNMFCYCSKISYIRCLATDISASLRTANWLGGTSSTGTFVKATSNESWQRNNDGIPSGWTVVNEDV